MSQFALIFFTSNIISFEYTVLLCHFKCSAEYICIVFVIFNEKTLLVIT